MYMSHSSTVPGNSESMTELNTAMATSGLSSFAILRALALPSTVFAMLLWLFTPKGGSVMTQLTRRFAWNLLHSSAESPCQIW